MDASPVDSWLICERAYRIANLKVRPMAHPRMPDQPMQSARGQATAYYIVDDNQTQWILKKFHRGCELERQYSRTIASLLPPVNGFESGVRRQVLDRASMKRGIPNGLRDWLDGVVMMPRIAGSDWSSIADRLRSGRLVLSENQRHALGRGLASLVQQLEMNGLAHRDLSSGNVMIDPQSLGVHLIDWDSLYHASLSMPPNTTCGSLGYIAPFVTRGGGGGDAVATWNPQGDRFALALLCVEFLVVSPDTELAGDGGMFVQEHLDRRQGPSIDVARRKLADIAPQALRLFDQALGAHNAAACPSPDEWSLACQPSPQAPPLVSIPALDDRDFLTYQSRLKVPAPIFHHVSLPPAPDFSNLPASGRSVVRPTVVATQAPSSLVPTTEGAQQAASHVPPAPPLPPDPWRI